MRTRHEPFKLSGEYVSVPPVIEKSVQAEYPAPVGDFNILPDEGVFTNADLIYSFCDGNFTAIVG